MGSYKISCFHKSSIIPVRKRHYFFNRKTKKTPPPKKNPTHKQKKPNQTKPNKSTWKQCYKPFLPFTRYMFAYFGTTHKTGMKNKTKPQNKERAALSHAISFFQKNQGANLHDKSKPIVVTHFWYLSPVWHQNWGFKTG